MSDSNFLLVSYWNSNHIFIRDALSWDLLSQINISEYAPFVSLEIDQVVTAFIDGNHFIFVGLRNGTLLILNVYPQVLKSKNNISN